MKYLQRTIRMASLYVFGAVANLVQLKIENNEMHVFQKIFSKSIFFSLSTFSPRSLIVYLVPN